MEPKFNSSFIPKKSLQADVSGTSPGRYVNQRSVKTPGYFLTFFIFLVSVAVSVGIFGYTKVVENRVTDLADAVEKKSAEARPEQIQRLAREDARLKGAQNILNNHVAFSALFALLEDVTLKKLRYSNLTYREGTLNTGASLTLSGQAKGFSPVALQTDQFNRSPYLNDPIVTQLTRPETEVGATAIADFAITLSVDPRLLSYSTALKSEGETVPRTTNTPTNTPNTTTVATGTSQTTPATGTSQATPVTSTSQATPATDTGEESTTAAESPTPPPPPPPPAPITTGTATQ